MESGKTILVVDDTADNIALISSVLRENHTVKAANSGEKALRIAFADPAPDLVLLDIMMPEMDGYEVCTRLKSSEKTRDIPVIFLTSMTEIEDERKGFELGAVDYIAKPISPPLLLARVATQLRLKAANDLLRNQNEILEQRVRERTKELLVTNESLARFVPNEFLKELGRDKISEVRLGDCKDAELTVLFSDIRSFTTLSESMSPQDTFNFVNSYFKRLGPKIRKNGGFIDKYIGDSIMALFPGNPENAVQAAIEIQRAIVEFNKEREYMGLSAVSAGIGLHRGCLILGTIGEEMRMETTVISNHVNLASRLEGLTKYYGARVIVSDAILSELPASARIETRFLDRVRVKGSSQPVLIYEILEKGIDPGYEAKREGKASFEAAVESYTHREFETCMAAMNELLDRYPHDTAAKFYVEKCRRNLSNCSDDDWDSTEEFNAK